MSEIKTLKVILSENIPLLEDRDSNTIYFVYDKLVVFLGKNPYYDPYAIVDEMPERPVFGILYFDLSDGFVKSYIDYEITNIAEIEDEEQLELLKQTGSTFFINSQRRYLDLARRIVTLPYKNGTYELTVSLANDLIIDEDTVIGFNPDSNMFELSGHRDGIVFTDHFGAKDTSTVDTTVEDNKISGNVKISSSYNNIIKVLNDGLYANADDRVLKKQFDSWTTSFSEYKVYMENYLRRLEEQIEDSNNFVSQESIAQRILEALQNVYPEIDQTFATLSEYVSKLEDIETRVKNYTDSNISDAYDSLSDLVKNATNDAWDDFLDEIPTSLGGLYNPSNE